MKLILNRKICELINRYVCQWWDDAEEETSFIINVKPQSFNIFSLLREVYFD